jgi:hypothetical protein
MRRFVVNLAKVDLSVENHFLKHVNLKYDCKDESENFDTIHERIAKFSGVEFLELWSMSDEWTLVLDSHWDTTMNSLKSLKEFKIHGGISAISSSKPWNLPVLKVLVLYIYNIIPENVLKVIFFR